MTPQTANEELPFRNDFAARVLNAADTIAQRRRKMRSAMATVSVVALIGVAAVGTVSMWLPGVPDQQHVPTMVASAGTDALASPANGQTTLLDIMFPHAAAVAQFSEQYEDGDSPDVLEDDAVFFPDADADVASES